MEAREHVNRVVEGTEKQPVGKTPQSCSSHVRQHDRELKRIGGYASRLMVEFVQKTCA
jgi:hypothetical protein